MGVSSSSTFAHDVIKLKNGRDIKAIIQEIGKDDIKFKKYDKPDGVLYTLAKWGIATIMYVDGRKQEFNVSTPNPRFIDTILKKNPVLDAFENRLNICGFTNRVVVWDFYSNKSNVSASDWTVGIWINRQEQLIAFRKDKFSYDETIIPINTIQNVKVIEIVTSRTISTEIGDWVKVGFSKTSEIVKEVNLRIVTGDINKGTNAYLIQLQKGHWNKSWGDYGDMEECIRRIYDEIGFMLSNPR